MKISRAERIQKVAKILRLEVPTPKKLPEYKRLMEYTYSKPKYGPLRWNKLYCPMGLHPLARWPAPWLWLQLPIKGLHGGDILAFATYWDNLPPSMTKREIAYVVRLIWPKFRIPRSSKKVRDKKHDR